MAAPYEEVKLEDMRWDEELSAFVYECPCGDLFQITRDELAAGEDIAHCPSCSLFVKVIDIPEDFSAEAPPPERPQPPLEPISVA